MPRKTFYAMIGLLAFVALLARWFSASRLSSPALFVPKSRTSVETSPMCSWREPDADLRAFFPKATSRRTETLILSGMRLELAKRLGRMPSGEENSLYLHRIYHEQHLLGTVITRRVKGEYGAIEIVLAILADGSVRGVRLQRLREPKVVADALRSPQWLKAFEGKTFESQWQSGTDIPNVPTEARSSAQAVVEGVRSLLVLLETAKRRDAPKAPITHH